MLIRTHFFALLLVFLFGVASHADIVILDQSENAASGHKLVTAAVDSVNQSAGFSFSGFERSETGPYTFDPILIVNGSRADTTAFYAGGSSTGRTAGVPEPGSLVVLSGVALCLLRTRRRQN